ncbi:4372_t:CDS:2 [Racocetra fulgida]|uniref:4372_t:CDS:1 n=1 Tax=Racocetra fulgida TaxID=60492 RepID=A0A9N9BCX1_9GLOM|nr:4372_t:CDS:2 [Racocetra fulgida]
MSSQKPLVVVSGATVRALTRKPDSDKAKALAAKGVEVFRADLSIKEDVKNALNGADIAFIVTSFWDPSIYPNNMAEEERQGKMIADVAQEVGLNWLLYSAYTSNFGTFFPIITKDDGTSEFVVPMVKEDTTIEIVDAEADTGPIVVKVIEEGPEKWNGRRVPIASESISFGKIAEILTKGSPNREEMKKEVPYLDNPKISDMFRWYNDYGVFRSEKEISDISIAKVLHPNITTFEQYAHKKWELQSKQMTIL